MNDRQYFDASSKLPTQQSYIHGRYHHSNTGQTFETIYPGNGEAICAVEAAGQADVDYAVESALEGFKIWSTTHAAARGKVLQRAAAILTERNMELAQLETLDTGKAISETSTVDILTGVEVMEYYAGIAAAIKGDHLDFPPNGFAVMKREPLGVCVGIGAWNYPIQIAMWKSSPALACGNSMIFKPSEYTPLSALKLAEIYSEAGLPAGVFNVVQGERETGSLLVDHPQVAKVSITGSVPTGKAVMAQSANTLKKVTLELGGKSPIIVFDDAQIDNAVNAIIPANFYSTGQVCSNGTRVFVQRGIYEQVLEQLVVDAKRIKIGDPFDPSVHMGPLSSNMQLEKVKAYLQAGRDSDARCLLDVDLSDSEFAAQGYFVGPAIFADCRDDMPFVAEEVFGPLMSVLPFDDEAEVIERANATELGLAGAVFTMDIARANRVANSLQAGSVWINDYHALPASVPFGGYKQSGQGRENGAAAIEHYTQVKMIYTNLGDVEATY